MVVRYPFGKTARIANLGLPFRLLGSRTGAVILFAIIAPLLSPTMPFDIRRTAVYQPTQTTYRPGLP